MAATRMATCPASAVAYVRVFEFVWPMVPTMGLKRRSSRCSPREFMAEEPVKPKGRNRKPKPATASLFDWALDMEKEREEELVDLSA